MCVAPQCLRGGVLQCKTLTLQLIDGMRSDGDVYGLLNVPHIDALLISHGSKIGSIWLKHVTAAKRQNESKSEEKCMKIPRFSTAYIPICN